MNTLEEQDNVLNQDKHEIDGRRVEVKIPDSRVSHLYLSNIFDAYFLENYSNFCRVKTSVIPFCLANRALTKCS